MATTKKSIKETKKEVVLNSVKNLYYDAFLQKTTEAQQKIQSSFLDIYASIQQAYQQLETLQAAIDLKKEELQTLHGLEPKLLEIEALQNKIEELQQEQLVLRQAWAREEAEYIYRRNQERKIEQDDYEHEFHLRKQKDLEEETQRKKLLEDREAALLAQEKQLLELKQELDAYPERTQEEAKKMMEEALAKQKLQFETRITIMEKDYQSEKRVHDQHMAAFQAQMHTLKEQNATLKQALDQTQRDMKELMTRYFESQSGREALQALERNRQQDSLPSPRK